MALEREAAREPDDECIKVLHEEILFNELIVDFRECLQTCCSKIRGRKGELRGGLSLSMWRKVEVEGSGKRMSNIAGYQP